MKKTYQLLLFTVVCFCLITLYAHLKPKPIKRTEYLAYWIYTPIETPIFGDTSKFEFYRRMPEIYTVTLNDGFKANDTVMVGYRDYVAGSGGYELYVIIQKVKTPVELPIAYEKKY